MSRYFVSLFLASVLYLPLLYLLFFYTPEEKEELEYLPIKISNFQTEKKEQKSLQPKAVQKKKLPKKLYQKEKKVVEKPLAKVAKEPQKKPKKIQEKKVVKKEDENQTIFVKAKPLKIKEINSLFQPKPKEISKEEKKLKDLYKDAYNSLSKKQREYLVENISAIGSITQSYLSFPYLAKRLNMSGKNMVEFYLSSNGNISEVKLITSSGYSLLDDNSIETIELAHKDYPYPQEKTRVRIYVEYVLN